MRFRSTILEVDGTTLVAELDAVDEHALHGTLADEGRVLLRVVPLDEARDLEVPQVRLSPRRLLLLTQALHEALDAGVPVLSTFTAVGEQEDDLRVARMLEDLGDRISSGQTLADALASHPRTFSPVYCALVRAGEHSGSLPEVLRSIASFLEWRIEIASTVRQAMLYPAIVLMAGYGMVLFLLSFVVPRLGDVISKIGSELPAASRFLIDGSSFVAAHIVWILVGTVVAVVAGVMAMRSDGVRRVALDGLGSLPVVREVMRSLAVAQFTRTFGVLLRAGLTMTEALRMGAASVALPRLSTSIERAGDRILGGARLAEALEEEQVLPPVALSMVKVGEEAGRLPITFERLGRLYDREVRDSVKRALGLMEPIVTVLLGVVVGGVAVLVVMTIYSAMKGLGR